ncbi:MAG: hypothetical protein ACRCYY_08930 [Trueperaceae bacterium]
MKANTLSVIIFLVFATGFSGCYIGYDPNADLAQLYINSKYPYSEDDVIKVPIIFIYTDSFSDERTAASAKIFLGDGRSVDTLNENGEGRIFSYYTNNSCQDLPQGENIRIRYEKYDAEGNVMQEDSIVVNIDSCR